VRLRGGEVYGLDVVDAASAVSVPPGVILKMVPLPLRPPSSVVP
jgi:hypothetical protein